MLSLAFAGGVVSSIFRRSLNSSVVILKCHRFLFSGDFCACFLLSQSCGLSFILMLFRLYSSLKHIFIHNRKQENNVKQLANFLMFSNFYSHIPSIIIPSVPYNFLHASEKYMVLNKHNVVEGSMS